MAMPKGPLKKQNKAFELEMEPLGVKLCAEGLVVGPTRALCSLRISQVAGRPNLHGPSPVTRPAGKAFYNWVLLKNQGREGKKRRCVGLWTAPGTLALRRGPFCLYSSYKASFLHLPTTTVRVHRCIRTRKGAGGGGGSLLS